MYVCLFVTNAYFIFRIQYTYSPDSRTAPCVSLTGHPRNAYDISPSTDMAPTRTFQAARYRARGLYLDMTRPLSRMPKAENTRPTVPKPQRHQPYVTDETICFFHLYVNNKYRHRHTRLNTYIYILLTII